MPKKIISTISLGLITVFAILFLISGGDDDKEILKETFQIEAVYYDSGHIEISYLDKSSETNSVVLEILGMENSFQKTFDNSEFIEIIPFPNIPKYGWAIHPVIFNIDHKEFGNIQLKTEIHELGQPLPPVIYGIP
ncbi:hypothetical protein NsoK4_02985 [Nitrosopumilus sp. K4]|uniref:hypothetical protein n=1 Tax=Nitrosopumilus sp. K4 TaxID=2795383 RepID=UPI001BA455EB|nr:hypothetical protein [Nitrosopumilus sp. K4]QUC65234.1 hypothetical protein NsoK4_02985 [Nitrosopumilus sp. K4]